MTHSSPGALVALFLATIIVAGSARGEQASLGPFEGHDDVGSPKKAGAAEFDAEKQQFTLSGSGTNMWEGRDEFQFVWKKMSGNFLLRTEVGLVGKGVEAHRKLGLIIRDSLDADAPYVDIAVHGDGTTSLQFRREKGGKTEQIFAPIMAPSVVQLERRGDKFIMSVAYSGETFAEERSVELKLGDKPYAGLFICAHNPDVIEKGEFRNVRIVVPAKDDFVPYRDYIGSNIEILDVATGRSEIVYHEDRSLQAPNWTTDGKALIYVAEGKLYRFDLATRGATVIDTGKAVHNNNDHVLSFDGKMLGISNAAEDDKNRSNVYTVPVEGGEPKRLTKEGPSYMHGWSPDGKTLVFTGDRGGELDIYSIPAAGGDEKKLTDTKGLDDGPEFTPDGKFIYFNSSRTGKMQIWRMGPGGSDQQSVTSDGWNNWFPHISPDGKQIVFITFPPEVKADDHPFYKHVYLRLMPFPGGPAKVIAYVYGGQGTINVPSWSPDSKRLAFVSNTAGE